MTATALSLVVAYFILLPLIGMVILLARRVTRARAKSNYTAEELSRDGYWLRHHNPVTGEAYTQDQASGSDWINP